MKKVPFLFLSLCAALSLFLGSSLSGVQRSAANLVAALYPVSYDVAYFDAAGKSILAKDVTVRFSADTAYLSSGESVSVSNARFVCLDRAALAQNTVRTGFAAAGLGLMLLAALLGATAFCARLCLPAYRSSLPRGAARREKQSHVCKPVRSARRLAA